MKRVVGPTPRERVGAGLCSAALVAGLGWALIAGLGVRLPVRSEEGLELFAVAPPPAVPKVRVEPERKRRERPKGETGAPNLRAEATEVVAPVPVVVLPVPTPVIAAPVAGSGSALSQGAADVPGPGFGAGGEGTGRGGGGSGDGFGEGDETPPRRVRGRLSSSMIPERLRERPGFHRYTVGLRYRVEQDGRVTGCRVTRSSGEAELDANTCRGVEERFRYRPARDEQGRAVRSIVVIDWDWDVEGPEPDG